jgi:hypothetical protein
MRIGLKSDERTEQLKNLKDGQLLYSAEYSSETGKVGPLIYIFKEYVKAPSKADEKGIWAKLQEACVDGDGKVMGLTSTDKKDGKPKDVLVVNDISAGAWFNYADCLEAFKQQFITMEKAVDNEIENVKQGKSLVSSIKE